MNKPMSSCHNKISISNMVFKLLFLVFLPGDIHKIKPNFRLFIEPLNSQLRYTALTYRDTSSSTHHVPSAEGESLELMQLHVACCVCVCVLECMCMCVSVFSLPLVFVNARVCGSVCVCIHLVPAPCPRQQQQE